MRKQFRFIVGFGKARQTRLRSVIEWPDFRF